MARVGVRDRGLRALLRRLRIPRDDFAPFPSRGGWPKDEGGDDGSPGVREPRRPVQPPNDLVAREPPP